MSPFYELFFASFRKIATEARRFNGREFTKLSFKRTSLCNFERKFHDRKIFHQFFIILDIKHKSTSYSNLTPKLAGLDFAYTPLFQRSRKFYFHELFFLNFDSEIQLPVLWPISGLDLLKFLKIAKLINFREQ